jgi:hypothetical protein
LNADLGKIKSSDSLLLLAIFICNRSLWVYFDNVRLVILACSASYAVGKCMRLDKVISRTPNNVDDGLSS